MNATDEALVDAARRGDGDAFAELVRRHQDAVYRVVRRIGRADAARAEDLAQDVFVRAYAHLGSFRHECPFKHWLLRIAHNLTLNRVSTVAARLERRTRSLDEPVRTDDGGEGMRVEVGDHRHEPPGRGAEREELAAALREAVAAMPDEYRAPVLLRDVEGLDYEAIAGVLALPIGTVRSRIHRGRDALRALLSRTWAKGGEPAALEGDGAGAAGGVLS